MYNMNYLEKSVENLSLNSAYIIGVMLGDGFAFHNKKSRVYVLNLNINKPSVI